MKSEGLGRKTDRKAKQMCIEQELAWGGGKAHPKDFYLISYFKGHL